MNVEFESGLYKCCQRLLQESPRWVLPFQRWDQSTGDTRAASHSDCWRSMINNTQKWVLELLDVYLEKIEIFFWVGWLGWG